MAGGNAGDGDFWGVAPEAADLIGEAIGGEDLVMPDIGDLAAETMGGTLEGVVV